MALCEKAYDLYDVALSVERERDELRVQVKGLERKLLARTSTLAVVSQPIEEVEVTPGWVWPTIAGSLVVGVATGVVLAVGAR